MTTLAIRLRRLLLPFLATGLCLWLADGVITTGVAGHYENDNQGRQALLWRPTSPKALAIEAQRLSQAEDHAAADLMAHRALDRSSLRADALRILALSASARDRGAVAQALMGRAGRLNPRDSDAQGWLLQRAVARGDFQRAVLHGDTLMRRSPDVRTPLAFTLAALMGDRKARAALVDRLSVDPPWREPFLTVASRNSADTDVAALFQALKSTASPVTDREAAAFFGRLVAERKYYRAKGYFDAFIGRSRRDLSLVYNGDFARRRGPPPFNWEDRAGLGGRAFWTSEGGAPPNVLRVSHDGFSSSGPLVRQLIVAPAGSYEVGLRTLVDDPLADGRFKLQVTCVNGSKLVSMTLHAAPGSWTPAHAAFDVPTDACEAQWILILPVTGDRRETADMAIDDIAVRRVAVHQPAPGEAGATR